MYCERIDLVNKDPMAEMQAGLELLHYRTPNLRHELFYWQQQASIHLRCTGHRASAGACAD